MYCTRPMHVRQMNVAIGQGLGKGIEFVISDTSFCPTAL